MFGKGRSKRGCVKWAEAGISILFDVLNDLDAVVCLEFKRGIIPMTF